MLEDAVMYAWLSDCKKRGINTQHVEEALVDLRRREIAKLEAENRELNE